MTEKNTQQIFDTVVTHLLSMKEQSSAERSLGCNTCMYRGNNGAMCAAGVLIPDDKYRDDMEGLMVYDIDFFYTHYDEEQLSMLSELQNIHDEKYNWIGGDGLTEPAIDDLKDVASRFKVEWKHD